MPVSFDRIDRLSEEVRRELDKIIREDVSDPRIQGTYSIVRADVTRDLRYAKVHVSVLEKEHQKPMLEALHRAAGFIRHQLGQRVQLRYTPELLFELDHNIEYGAHIAQVIENVILAEKRADDEEHP